MSSLFRSSLFHTGEPKLTSQQYPFHLILFSAVFCADKVKPGPPFHHLLYHLSTSSSVYPRLFFFTVLCWAIFTKQTTTRFPNHLSFHILTITRGSDILQTFSSDYLAHVANIFSYMVCSASDLKGLHFFSLTIVLKIDAVWMNASPLKTFDRGV